MKKVFKKFNRPAVAIATFIAGMHALWALMVAIGVGQAYLDWIFPLHFIGTTFSVMSFSLLTALLLIIVAFIATYLAVLLFGVVWTLMMKKK